MGINDECTMRIPSEEIIDKVLFDLGTAKEAESVARWFKTDEGYAYLTKKMDADFLSIKKDYEELAAGHDIPSEKMLDIILMRINKKRKLRLYMSAAAILLPLVLFAGLFFQLNSRVNLLGRVEYDEIYVPKGKRLQMMFQDGTSVHINSDTKIRYPKQFGLGNRKVFLEGEAYFVVEKNSKRPFVIEMDSATIKVMGTSFGVQAYPEKTEISVTLDEGKINFIPWTKSRNILATHQKLVLNKKTGECEIDQ